MLLIHNKSVKSKIPITKKNKRYETQIFYYLNKIFLAFSAKTRLVSRDSFSNIFFSFYITSVIYRHSTYTFRKNQFSKKKPFTLQCKHNITCKLSQFHTTLPTQTPHETVKIYFVSNYRNTEKIVNCYSNPPIPFILFFFLYIA